ncbi:branched-chain amino acid ABC transporter permease [Nocardioides sp.]|uniref:branched-chain amino acid ABC transporter permease n=1 Tax=Nocardioides sp. TaxID=35761 RepID=UPI0039E28D0D
MKLPVVVKRDSAAYRGLYVAALIAIAVLVFWGSTLERFEMGQVTRVMIFAIAIAGLNIATGYTGLLSVGHSAFFGIGAYTTGILVVKHDWAAWATIPVSAFVCLIVGLLVGLPALRIRGLYLAMVTLAFAVAFPEMVARFDGLTGGSSGMSIPRALLRPPEWSGYALGQKDVWLYWVAIVVLLVTMYLIRSLIRSRYGLAMTAVRQNEIAAASSGMNIAVVKVAMFGISGAITGAAGGLFAMYLGSLYAEGSFTLLAGITLLIGLVIGGERTLLGPLIGGVITVYVPYYTSDLGQGQASAVLFAVVLILVIFLAPSGIAGGLGRLGRRFVVFRPARPAPVAGRSANPPDAHRAPPVPDGSLTVKERQDS